MISQYTHLRSIADQNGAVILDTKAGSITTLNSSGAYVWLALERGEAIGTIAESLARETGEPIETVRADLADFVDALKNQDLLSD